MESTESGKELESNRNKCYLVWLKKLAGPKLFLFFFCLIGIMQGAYFSYFVGILTTLEKRYSFDSSVTACILIADNLSPLLFSIFVGYYAKKCNRPKAIVCGMMVTVFSCFLCCAPYLIYGHKSAHEFDHDIFRSNEIDLCTGNSTFSSDQRCDIKELSTSYIAISILFIANFLNGCGAIAYYTIGTSYVDDSAKKKNSPLYLGAFFALRLIGPTLGFALSSFCLHLFENPFVDPGLSDRDPEWIGAWWLGFLILGLSLLITSLPIAAFPKSLKKNAISECEAVSMPFKKMFQDLGRSLKELCKNKILFCHTLSITFQINGLFGYYTFMPKYMETQYLQTASKASLFSGMTSLFTFFGGIACVGFLIYLLKPAPRYLTGYVVFVELFAIGGLVSALFFGCPSPDMFAVSHGAVNLSQTCNSDCGCSKNLYDPVCAAGSVLFYSPCFAGCHDSSIINNITVFQNCSCIKQYFENPPEIFDAKQGYCNFSCDMFLPYFLIMTICKVLAYTSKVGNFLIRLRCVADEDKSLALGTVESFLSIFATIPYPFIYGYFIDSACLVWEENCGKKGNCRLYDSEKFRNYFHSLSIAFLICGSFFGFIVCYLSKNMENMYGQDDRSQEPQPDCAQETLM